MNTTAGTRHALLLSVALTLVACGGDGGSLAPAPTPSPSPSSSPSPSPGPSPSPSPTATVTTQAIARFDNPWAVTFLPDGKLLVTEKPGNLRIVTVSGTVSAPVANVPAVGYAGQGGLQDVILDPDFGVNHTLYLSYAETGSGGKGLTVASAVLNEGAGSLSSVKVIWRQQPKVSGDGQFGGRMAFSPDGHLFIAAGERQKETPAQDLSGTLGKIVRIDSDGSVPSGNPFASTAGARPEIWTLGHRNPYGLVFADDGRLFEIEMGPSGGDEFNLIAVGKNYGWPNVSEGDNYDGSPIPRHSTNPAYTAPLVSWTPVIAPGGMIQYHGDRFVGWDGDFVIAGLVAQGIVRVRVSGDTAKEVDRIGLGNRIRDIEEAPDGAIWVLEDGGSGRLLKLTPG